MNKFSVAVVMEGVFYLFDCNVFIIVLYDKTRHILLTAIGLTPGRSSTVYIYTQVIHRTTQWNRIYRTHVTMKIHKHIIRIHF